jgi:hypothetical protein
MARVDCHLKISPDSEAMRVKQLCKVQLQGSFIIQMLSLPLPRFIPVLRNIIVELVHEFKYVGIWLTSTTANIFSRNYAIKASKARNACYAIFAMKHRIRSLPVKEGLQLYMARVDCYLISAAETSIDVNAHLLDDYLDTQHLFLRRLLGINSRSMLAVLFTETGLMPIRIRRLLLALSRLRYIVGLPDDRRVRSALLDSVDLFAAGNACWTSDIAILLCALPIPIHIVPTDFLSIPIIDDIVVEATDADLQFDINFLQKTRLLRDRLELAGDSNTLALVTRRRRHYLTMVAVPAHRMALTRMILSDHNVSVERLRYRVRYRLPIPREERLCRFCRGAVEDEVHALLDCNAHPPLIDLRLPFLREIIALDPALQLFPVSLQLPPSDDVVEEGSPAAGKICVRCLHGLQ